MESEIVKPTFDIEKWMAAKEVAMNTVSIERHRQLKNWGSKAHDMPTWLAILMEEVGELAQQTLREKFDDPSEDQVENMKTEAIQVAAVALAIVQYLETGEA